MVDETSKARERRHLFVSGKVQGVFFRDSAQTEACRLNITGFVRNLSDGRVEMAIEGDVDPLNRFIAWCREGPPSARVDHVEVLEEPYRGEFQAFTIQRSL